MCWRLVKIPKHSRNEFIYEHFLKSNALNDYVRQNSYGNFVRLTLSYLKEYLVRGPITIYFKFFNLFVDFGLLERGS